MTSKAEARCREIIERLTEKKFPSGRYEFLTNPETNKRLELDMYCPEMGLAIEYQGEQHYKYVEGKGPFHACEKDFINQVRRDSFKKEMCQRLGIYLIIVPYTVEHKIHLEPYIKKKLQEYYSC